MLGSWRNVRGMRDSMEIVGRTDYVFKWNTHQGVVKANTLPAGFDQHLEYDGVWGRLTGRECCQCVSNGLSGQRQLDL